MTMVPANSLQAFTNIWIMAAIHSNVPTAAYGLCCLRWQDLTTTLDGPEVGIFREACKKNKVRLTEPAVSISRAAGATWQPACSDCVEPCWQVAHYGVMVDRQSQALSPAGLSPAEPAAEQCTVFDSIPASMQCTACMALSNGGQWWSSGRMAWHACMWAPEGWQQGWVLPCRVTWHPTGVRDLQHHRGAAP